MRNSDPPKVTAVIQARMASRRLPGKVLKEVCGRPILGWVIERAHRAETLDQVVVATTTDTSDDPIVEYCAENQIPFYRGSHQDVLDRYFQAARNFSSDVIVRLTADCPLIDPELIDMAVSEFTAGSFDYLTNRLPSPWGRSFPIGLDVEVFSFQALEKIRSAATETHHREHVTPYFYEEIPPEKLRFSPDHATSGVEYISKRGFRMKLLHYDRDLSDLRWTVDTPEDLRLVRSLTSHFEGMDFSWLDLLEIVNQNPSLKKINAEVKHKSHRDIDERS